MASSILGTFGPMSWNPISGLKGAYHIASDISHRTQEVVKGYASIMGQATEVATNIGEVGLSIGTTAVQLCSGDLSPVKNALGYNNFKEAVKAYKLQSKETTETIDEDFSNEEEFSSEEEFGSEDMRSFPQRVRESVGHIGYGITKAIVTTTYTTALAVGTVSNLAEFKAASPLSLHGGAKGVAHATSYMTQGAWWATKQVAYAGQNALTTTLSSPNYIKAAVLTTSLGFTLYKVGSNLKAVEEAENMGDKFKASAAAAAWTAASIALPVLAFTS